MKPTNRTVAEYAVARIAALGIDHAFGVPGDFSFPIDDAIESQGLKWVLSANELNASYAADAYARLRGAALLTVTYAVGELSSLNGLMGAAAERVPVFQLVGQPSHRSQRNRQITHHTWGDGDMGRFAPLSAAACCATTTLTPTNAVQEMERIVSTAIREQQPAYVGIPMDYAREAVVGDPGTGWGDARQAPVSDPVELAEACDAIRARMADADSLAILPGILLQRYGLVPALLEILVATGAPYATMPMSKGIVSESHPQFIGMYAGNSSDSGVSATVEGADLVLDLGGNVFSDINTGMYSARIDPARLITVGADHVRIGQRTYGPVFLGDVLSRLVTSAPRFDAVMATVDAGLPTTVTEPKRPLSMDVLYSRVQDFLRPGDVFIVDIGYGQLLIPRMRFPDGVTYLVQNLWGSIGWSTPAALGAGLADPQRRVVVVTGDGAHQVTANELGALARYGVKPVIIVTNNDTYAIEEALTEGRGHVYDDIAPWEYELLPVAMGCRDWMSVKVTTVAELDAALAAAAEKDAASYIRAVLPPADSPPSLPDAVKGEIYQVDFTRRPQT